MKLYYLKEVQALFDNYDFQDKYKILLDLENYITKLEQKGIDNPEVLISKLGTPEQFVQRVANKYKLTPLDGNSTSSSSLQNTEDLLAETGTSANSDNFTEDITLKMEPVNNTETTLGEEEENYRDDFEEQPAKQPFDNPAKKPFGIFFKILSTILYILSLLVTTVAIIVSIAMVLVIDIQTAISFFLGIMLGIVAGLLTLSSIKNFVYGILDNNLKVGTIIIKIIIVVICVIAANSLVSSSIDKLTLYVTSNLSSVQELLNGLNIDITEIDWQNLELSDYTELGIEIVKSYLMG